MSIYRSPLGKNVDAPQEFDPSVLFAIPRRDARIERGITEDLPFDGYDLWNCYEVSWLDDHGIPRVAMARIQYSCSTENIVESKSLKLFLGSLNSTRVKSLSDVENLITASLSEIVGGTCNVELIPPGAWSTQLSSPDGICVDEVHPASTDNIVFGSENVVETLYSNLLCTLCPVTKQPDWATVVMSYDGPQIERETFLSYIVSFRNRACFHESAAEMFFMEILENGNPEKLRVACFYTRRGGIDINPIRHTFGFESKSYYTRLVRQ
jgi:7-cyano-7-deazaguanine reductase